ncbi:MAG: glycosyltransferase family 9 protein [Gammaproteobacteria bacterium]|nr:glycosyltransferase family 9 protein [Gammaproteobacteria bacterium]
MFVPLIRTLQHYFPNATLTWVISRPAYDLVEGLEGVEFMVIEKPKGIRDYYRLYQQFKGRSFDVLLAAQASFSANIVYPLIRAKRKIGYDYLRAKDGHGWFVNESIGEGCDHTLEGFLRFGKAIGATLPVIRWDLPISEEDRAWVKAQVPMQRPILVINPAASKPERSWLIDRYCSIAKMAPSRWGVQVVLTGGPGAHDRDFAEQIQRAAPDCINMVGKTKPKQLLALIEAASGVLCPDTGPSHMGASVSTPVVALHAVTGAGVSGPYPYLDLAVDYYPQALRSILHLEPGQQVWGTHVHDNAAMALIPVDAVVAKLDRILMPS